MNLAPLIDDAFSQFETFIQENASLAYSRGMPILYFGNLTAYAKAPKRIVTAALNPADGEFNIEGDYSLKHRFPKYKTLLKESTYLISLNAYFEERPYNWFKLGYEPVLNGLNASYYGKLFFKNTAIHTDVGSPICTKKLWSDPSFPKETRNQLQKNGKTLWFNLMRELEPDIILISVNERLMQETFGQNWKKNAEVIWNSTEAANKRGYKDLLENGKLRSMQYEVYSFAHEALPNTKIIWGKANVKPFGDLAFRKDPKIRVWLGEDLGAMFKT